MEQGGGERRREKEKTCQHPSSAVLIPLIKALLASLLPWPPSSIRLPVEAHRNLFTDENSRFFARPRKLKMTGNAFEL